MMKTLSRLTLIIIGAFIQLSAGAQQIKDSIRVSAMAKVQKDAILLRWAVNAPGAWKLANQYGYRLERYTVVRDKQLLDKPEKVVLTSLPLVPKPLASWERLAQRDSYAAIIAQALYGQDFEVSAGAQKGLASIVSRSQELDQRFGFSLYAADHSFEGATMAGWAWKDSTAKTGEKYLYRIIAAVPPQKLHIDSASVYVGLEDYEPLPVPQEISAIFGDKTVLLSWNCSLLRKYYTSYYVEKSADGKNFVRASDLPLTNLADKAGKEAERIFFTDSLKDNETEWQYRIIGVSTFGELGPPSAVTLGKGRKLLEYVPDIRSAFADEHGTVTINWNFEKEGNSLIKSFTISKASRPDGKYELVKDNIRPDARSTDIIFTGSSAYFTIRAEALEGESRTSQPYLVQPVDSIAPLAPAGLHAEVEKNGVVHLGWTANTEKDLYGYKVFRANRKGDALIAVADTLNKTPVFRDSIALKTLNTKVYYAVVAFDRRQNQSEFSEILELKRPDIIPPSKPLITGYELKEGVVLISWKAGIDPDLASFTLLRREAGRADTSWLKIKAVPLASLNKPISDSTALGGHTYWYSLQVQDQSGLYSEKAEALKVICPVQEDDGDLKRLTAYVDRKNRYIELSWNNKIAGIKEFRLYKGEGGKPPALWKVVDARQRRIIDADIRISTNYTYGIAAVGTGGESGKVVITSLVY